MSYYNKPADISAFDAKFEAQKIAFAPVAFQAAHSLLKFGILKTIDAAGNAGISLEDLKKECPLSHYALGVLLDMGLSMRLFWKNKQGHCVLDKTGHFLVNDSMARINLEFVQDICYRGMAELDTSLEKGEPKGLKHFGDWPTIYPALSTLPQKAKKSWFAFDHFYSDQAFSHVLPLLFADKPAHILDIGGNTGKWALACTDYDDDVLITIADLPQQIDAALHNAKNKAMAERISGFKIDLLDSEAKLPGVKSHPTPIDCIWMSQFLDCFAPEQIISILKRAAAIMNGTTRLFILETFCDRQPSEAGAYCVNATSLYFSAIANGTSRMYHAKEIHKLIRNSGLYIDDEWDGLGIGHTLICCRLKPS